MSQCRTMLVGSKRPPFAGRVYNESVRGFQGTIISICSKCNIRSKVHTAKKTWTGEGPIPP